MVMIMGELAAIGIVGIISIVIYRVFELFVRKNERMKIIEKLGEQIKLSEANVDLNLPLFQKSGSNWALRISLLLIGIGTGLVAAYWIDFVTAGANRIQIVYFACLAIFGGAGLLTAYFIERKQKAD